jgi:hypothetical protein
MSESNSAAAVMLSGGRRGRASVCVDGPHPGLSERRDLAVSAGLDLGGEDPPMFTALYRIL